MKLLPAPFTLTLAAAFAPRERGMAALQALAAAGEQRPAADARGGAGELDWQSAWQRVRAQDEQEQQDESPEAQAQATLPPMPALVPREQPPEATPVRAVGPATPTTERLAALQPLAEAGPAAVPVARVWQVELPAAVAGPAWQLCVEQAQPLAPLSLELRVPPVAQLQARQQLGDLDKRLRDAGHDVLRPRLRDTSRSARRSRPVDEVDS